MSLFSTYITSMTQRVPYGPDEISFIEYLLKYGCHFKSRFGGCKFSCKYLGIFCDNPFTVHLSAESVPFRSDVHLNVRFIYLFQH